MFGKFFGSRRETQSIGGTTSAILLKIGIRQPSSEVFLLSLLGVTASSITIINDLAGPLAIGIIEEISEEAYEAANANRCAINSLFSSKYLPMTFDEFLSHSSIRKVVKLEPSTIVNGAVSFPVLLDVAGRRIVEEIMTKGTGPLGFLGFSAVVIERLSTSKESTSQNMFAIIDLLKRYVLSKK